MMVFSKPDEEKRARSVSSLSKARVVRWYQTAKLWWRGMGDVVVISESDP